ncbi:enoyl-CoA hydratase/isomerase family protein [Streptomyces sp. NPDC056835]|uniref:enoyl-CoA hydratase/isomerase family protein n=1 Tax=Streptomyces sp. NPDC056835 TaxID=3345956 RepID=UPI0036B0C9EE
MEPGPTGLHPYADNLIRLSRVPAVTITSINGRARGAGSEFVLATDIRFAGPQAVLGQFEVGTGSVPGGNPMARLVGRGRAMEIMLGADDFPRRAGRRVRLRQPGHPRGRARRLRRHVRPPHRGVRQGGGGRGQVPPRRERPGSRRGVRGQSRAFFRSSGRPENAHRGAPPLRSLCCCTARKSPSRIP